MALTYACFDFLFDNDFWSGADLSGLTPTELDDIDDLRELWGDEVMTSIAGTIHMVAGATPDNALECDGSAYLRVDYPTLYAILDAVFIVDADNFVVPDLRGRVPLGVGTGSGLSAYAMGDQIGEEAHQLITGELASHAHTDSGHNHTEVTAVPAVGAALVGVPIPSAIPGVGVTGTGFANIGSTGSDTPHENRQPSLALRFVIVAF